MPTPISFDYDAMVDEIFEQRCHEQRLSLGPLEHRVGQNRRQCIVGEPQREITLDFDSRQPIQTQLATAPMYFQILMQAPNRMFLDDTIGGPISTEDQHRGLAGPPCEAREHVQGRKVAPVQVLENDGPWLVRTQRLNKIAKFAEHALPARAKQFALELGVLRGINDARYLQHPGWRIT